MCAYHDSVKKNYMINKSVAYNSIETQSIQKLSHISDNSAFGI